MDFAGTPSIQHSHELTTNLGEFRARDTALRHGNILPAPTGVR